jgi:NTP pyrophosphatase (non-canonical NTP hydrolase)
MYQKHALRTINRELDLDKQFNNFALGIVGELGEVAELLDAIQEDIEPITNEIGDVFWYIANFCSFLQYDWRQLFPQKNKRIKLGSASNTAFRYAAKIADSVKKTTAQNHTLDNPQIIANLAGIMNSLASIYAYYGVTPQEICTYNHLKLLKRYPGGFETERSTQREV